MKRVFLNKILLIKTFFLVLVGVFLFQAYFIPKTTIQQGTDFSCNIVNYHETIISNSNLPFETNQFPFYKKENENEKEDDIRHLTSSDLTLSELFNLKHPVLGFKKTNFSLSIVLDLTKTYLINRALLI